MMTNRLTVARYTATNTLGLILESSDYYDIEDPNLLDYDDDHISESSDLSDASLLLKHLLTMHQPPHLVAGPRCGSI